MTICVSSVYYVGNLSYSVLFVDCFTAVIRGQCWRCYSYETYTCWRRWLYALHSLRGTMIVSAETRVVFFARKMFK